MNMHDAYCARRKHSITEKQSWEFFSLSTYQPGSLKFETAEFLASLDGHSLGHHSRAPPDS